MAEDFTSSDNVCRKSLLEIVARGSALLAEMQRLHTFIPKVSLTPSRSSSTPARNTKTSSILSSISPK